MKKNTLLFMLTLFLGGCVTTSDEINTLKIKIINLESITQKQEKQISLLEKKQEELEKRLLDEISKNLLQSQSKIIADLEDTKKEIAQLQGKVEDLTFQQEGERKTFTRTMEDFKTRLDTVELKLKELEKQPKDLEKSVTEKTYNETVANATQSQNENKTTQQIPEKREEKVSQKVEKEHFKEEDLYQRAYTLYGKGDLKGARRLWEEYLNLYPKGKLVGQTYFYIGETYFKEKDYESAILSYQKLIELPGPNPLKAKAMLRQGDAFLALKDKKAAQILFKKVIQNYPGTEEAKEAQKKIKELK